MDDNFVEAVKQLADEATGGEPVSFSTGRYGPIDDLQVFVLADGQHLDSVDLGQHAAQPWRRSGLVTLYDQDSLVVYILRNQAGFDATTVWGDRRKGHIVAVFDDHAIDRAPSEKTSGLPGAPGWADHRATLVLRKDEDWQTWISKNGVLMDQESFADFLEQVAGTILATPNVDQALMYEIATTLRAKKAVDFQSAVNTTNGEVKFGYEETVSAKAGTKGNIEIPRSFTIDCAVYEGGAPIQVEARFIYRIQNSHLLLGYRLQRADAWERHAFNAILDYLSAQTGLAVMSGSPRERR